MFTIRLLTWERKKWTKIAFYLNLHLIFLKYRVHRFLEVQTYIKKIYAFDLTQVVIISVAFLFLLVVMVFPFLNHFVNIDSRQYYGGCCRPLFLFSCKHSSVDLRSLGRCKPTTNPLTVLLDILMFTLTILLTFRKNHKMFRCFYFSLSSLVFVYVCLWFRNK